MLLKDLEEFTLHLTGNWFGEPIEKIPVFLDPLRELHLRGGPGRKWRIYLPPQPYYSNKMEIARLDELMIKEGICCEIFHAGQ